VKNKWSYTETETHVEIDCNGRPLILIKPKDGKVDLWWIQAVIQSLNYLKNAEPFEVQK
jgi:hypothetical protein